MVGIVAVIMMINTVKNCNSGRNNSAAICASAEEIENQNEIENIKSNNMFDFSKYILNSTIKVTCDNPLDNGTFSFKGYSDREWQRLIYIYDIDDKLKDGNTYTLSQSKYFGTATGAVYMVITAKDVNEVEQQIIHTIEESRSFTVDFAKYHHYNIGIIFGVPDGFYVDEKISFMFNEGAEELPYEPNLQGLYETARDQGYTDGEKTGYDSGIIKGQSIAKNGIFADATISGYILFSPLNENDKITFNYENNQIKFVSGGIDFYQFAKTLENQSYEKWGDDWEKTYMNINLKEPIALSSLSLFGQGNSTSFFGAYRVTDTSGNIYSIKWINDDIWKTDIPEDLKKQNINISKISFQWGGGVEGMEVTIYQEGIGYEAGFANGYNQGKDEGYDSGYNIGNKQGYDSGYGEGQAAGETIGYDKAVNEGMSGTGLLFGIFSFIKVFFKLMTQLLSVKVAGDMTVALFVIGIPAAGMIINWVIRLVQNLATGGNGGGNSE